MGCPSAYVLVATLFGCIASAVPVPVPGTSISLEPPAGMAPATRFAGFESKTEDASITVTELPAPLASTTAGFRDTQKLEAQRMRLERVDRATLASGSVDIYVMTQRAAGIEYHKQVLALGDEKRAILVVAACDKDIVAKWEPLLRNSLLTVTVGERAAGSTNALHVEPKGAFRLARNVAGSLVFSVDGQFPLADPRSPLFLVSRSAAALPASGIERFAEARARSLPGVKELRVAATKPVQIDGLEGLELTAFSNESDPAAASVIFEVVLRDVEDAGGYYLLVGLARKETADVHLPLFREMSASFRRR